MGADLTLTFQAQPDKRLLTAAIRHILRTRLLIVRVLGAFVVLCGVYTMIITNGNLFYLVFYGLLGLFLGAGLSELVVWRSVRASVDMSARPTRFRFAPDGLGVSTDVAQTGMSWAAVTDFTVLPGQIVLRISKRQFICVPTGGLTEEEFVQLRTLLRDRGAVASHAAPESPAGVRPPTP
ncbi:YcxB family protein [Actinoplanes friuliensis]|jgi:hypothetical protein|uniref:YcxB-like C-terminal domain-containing protein n=1 Tax=Actinoplanes friuliensis DSM 7358 TaxID=1246995 RepID=U5W8Z3_9ACTN|nr:YcxB family protein [Actinoplanes friuliensis]AGZ45487.1 hypothetical protein AFR_36155 [Actinoplanes friuliensis DSM 7358]